MGKLSLGEAARVSGLSKPTISKYLKTGKISGHQRPEDKVWEIDEAEIVRLMAARDAPQRGKTPQTKAAEQAASEAESDTGAETALEVEVRMLREALAEAKEREAKALSQLEKATENERGAWEKVTRLLESPKQQSWWARVFKGNNK